MVSLSIQNPIFGCGLKITYSEVGNFTKLLGCPDAGSQQTGLKPLKGSMKILKSDALKSLKKDCNFNRAILFLGKSRRVGQIT